MVICYLEMKGTMCDRWLYCFLVAVELTSFLTKFVGRIFGVREGRGGGALVMGAFVAVHAHARHPGESLLTESVRVM